MPVPPEDMLPGDSTATRQRRVEDRVREVSSSLADHDDWSRIKTAEIEERFRESNSDRQRIHTEISTLHGRITTIDQGLVAARGESAVLATTVRNLERGMETMNRVLVGGPEMDGGLRKDVRALTAGFESFLSNRETEQSVEKRRRERSIYWWRIIAGLTSLVSLVLAFSGHRV